VLISTQLPILDWGLGDKQYTFTSSLDYIVVVRLSW